MVQLPNKAARTQLLGTLLKDRVDESDETTSLEKLSDALEGWSGSDIKSLAKEMAMYPLRRTIAKLESISMTHEEEAGTGKGKGSGKGNGKPSSIPIAPVDDSEVKLEMITADDIALALKRVKPAPLSCEKSKYSAWTEAFGST